MAPCALCTLMWIGDMLQEINSDWWAGLFKDDPVRPHIPASMRMTGNRKAFVLMAENCVDARAVICCSFCDEVATDELELLDRGDDVAMFYTVWSYDKGAGREIIFKVTDWIKENKPTVKRFVTLSPKTEMARKFHLKNGAFELQENEDTINYEYPVLS